MAISINEVAHNDEITQYELATSSDLNEYNENKSIENDFSKSVKTQWSVIGGNFYTGVAHVTPTIEPGVYKPAVINQMIGLKRINLSTDDIIEFDDSPTKQVIEEIEYFWNNKDRFKKHGYLHKRGILMHGEPGSSKTTTVKILINKIIERGGIAIYADNPDRTSETLHMLRQIEPDKPIILVMEDLEVLCEHNTHNENLWLSILDGETQVDNVVYLATTNYIERLDKRFIDRPSRFDVIVPVNMPTANVRATYFSMKIPDVSDELLIELVNATENMSVAHLKEVVISTQVYGRPLKEVISRMKIMRKRKYSSEDFTERENIGFGSRSDYKEKKFDILEWKKMYIRQER